VIEGAQVETYKRVGAQELKLWLFGVDSAAAPKPAIVFFFGGGWRKGSPEQFVRQGRYLADRGMVAVMADYRVASRNHVKPAECVADAKSCVRWLRQNAGRLGIDPRRLAAAGGSAGGHLAVSAATLPGLDEADEDLSVSSIPDAAVLFNAGFMMAPFGSLKMRGFGANHKKESFGCEPEAISPIHHVRSGLPPMLILHGTADKVIPFESAEAFCKEMTDAGNRCELVGYEGMDHGFYLGDRYYETLGEMVRFLNSIGFLPKGL
jgi:acetyl esterase/lipase